MWQSRVDSSSETFLTPAQRKRLKSSFLNMVSKKNQPLLNNSYPWLSLSYFDYFPGPLAEVHFPIDNLTKKPKGFSFVTYMIPENAVVALAQLDGHIFQVFEMFYMYLTAAGKNEV